MEVYAMSTPEPNLGTPHGNPYAPPHEAFIRDRHWCLIILPLSGARVVENALDSFRFPWNVASHPKQLWFVTGCSIAERMCDRSSSWRLCKMLEMTSLHSRHRPCLTSLWIGTPSSIIRCTIFYRVHDLHLAKKKLSRKWPWVAVETSRWWQTVSKCLQPRSPTKKTPHSHTASECWSKLLICRCIRRHFTCAQHLQNSHGCAILRWPDANCSRVAMFTARPWEVSTISVLQMTS